MSDTAPQPPAEEPSDGDRNCYKLERAIRKMVIEDEPSANDVGFWPQGKIREAIAAYRAKCVAEATEQLRDQLGALQSSLGACENVRLSEALSSLRARLTAVHAALVAPMPDASTATYQTTCEALRRNIAEAFKVLDGGVVTPDGRDALIVQMREALAFCLPVMRNCPVSVTNVYAAVGELEDALALVPESLAGKVLVNAKDFDAFNIARMVSRQVDAEQLNAALTAELSLAKAKISELEKAK